LRFLIEPSDFSYKRVECLIDIDLLLCGTFNEFALELFSQISAFYRMNRLTRSSQIAVGTITLSRNLSFALQIALISHNDDGKEVLVLNTQNLLMKR
jgi:hypothetical protein